VSYRGGARPRPTPVAPGGTPPASFQSLNAAAAGAPPSSPERVTIQPLDRRQQSLVKVAKQRVGGCARLDGCHTHF
jgi:hypothetical protein